jgi:hypothetical protein
MNLPVLEILKQGHQNVVGDVDYWTEYIDAFAPCYLSQEAAGDCFAYEYDHDKFIEVVPNGRISRRP